MLIYKDFDTHHPLVVTHKGEYIVDPITTLTDLLETLSQDDAEREDVLQHLNDLQEWVAGGGFIPLLSRYKNTNTDPSDVLYKVAPNE